MKERNSNIEVLRIVCMLMVMILHFNNQCANQNLLQFPKELTSQYIFGFLIESFCIIAVNCFVLISGYFGVKFNVRSIFKLYLKCFFVGLVSYLLYVTLTPSNLELKPLMGRLLAFTHNHWWYIISYICLIFISPLLNSAVNSLSKKKLVLSIFLYGFIVIYIGWYKNLESTNCGYSFVSFIFLYLIGRYIGKYVSFQWIRDKRWYWGISYFIGSFILFLCVMLYYYANLNIHHVFQYDHPIVILNSCFLLLFFLSFKFTNNKVNWFASSVLTAYLLQESTYLGHKLIYPAVSKLFTPPLCPPYSWILLLIVVSIVFLIVSVILDKILNILINMILSLYDKYVSDYINI